MRWSVACSVLLVLSPVVAGCSEEAPPAVREAEPSVSAVISSGATLVYLVEHRDEPDSAVAPMPYGVVGVPVRNVAQAVLGRPYGIYAIAPRQLTRKIPAATTMMPATIHVPVGI